MFRNIESVIKHFDRYSDYDAYKLYRGKEAKDNKGGLIDESREDEDHGSCKVRLTAVLNDLGPGTYLVQFKKNPKATTDIINANFEVPYTTGQAAIGSPAGMGGIDTRSYVHRDDIEKIIAAKIGEVTATHKLERLEEKFEDFKKQKEEKETPLEKILNGPTGQMLIGMLMRGKTLPQAMAGPGSQQVIVTDMNLRQPPIVEQQQQHTPTPQDEERERKIQEIFAIATQIEGNGDAGIELLHKLAHYCLQQQNQPMFQMIKQQVMQTVPQPVHF